MKLKDLIKECKATANAHGWHIDWEISRKPINPDLSVGEALALIHSEVSEALEAYRDNDKEEFSKEISGLLIRIFHLIGDLHIPIEEYLKTEMERNSSRPFKHGRVTY